MPTARVRDTTCQLRTLNVPNWHAVRLHICYVPSAQFPTADIANMRLMATIANASYACNATRHIRVPVVPHMKKSIL